MTDGPDGGRDAKLPKKSDVFFGNPNIITGNNIGTTLSSPAIVQLISKISQTKADDVQAVAASQIGLLVGYHEIVLAQSKRSFAWALTGAGTGMVFFMAAVGLALWTDKVAAVLIPAISGAVVEVIAGVVFYLYGKTTSQLGEFHGRLETLQRYPLANSICESLQGEACEKVRSDLIRAIARITPEPLKPS
jgi:hypothetical protein